MRERWRKLLRYAGVCLGLFLVGSVVGCPIQRLTGIPCPACGMSRAWKCVLLLEFRHALEYHPLFWMAPWIVLLIVREGTVRDPSAEKRQRRSILVVSIALIGVYVWRILLVPHGPVAIRIEDGLLYKAVYFLSRRL